MSTIINLFLHLDTHLNAFVNHYGVLSYVLLFAIIFIETGLVIFPFLPGDSLLFAAGSISAIPGNILNHYILMLLFFIAAFAGDNLNFYFGKKLGYEFIKHPFWGKFIKPKYIDDAQAFYNKYGKLAIFLARYMPIIRTLTPFTAAIAKFNYKKFVTINLIAAVSWVFIAVESGYYFGRIPFIQKHFSIIIFGILFISVIPILVGIIKSKIKN